ncbi:MAG: hypothetical protein CVT95_10020 [Bacteroidetes bacterium HGW-Bacteroidetes-12]|jgi:hypothetical protein|nr:MAG: hypothetical protein CVT95_10020 [Bacteroidetes bacterium HGW-Bacteroidetes-12]
MLDLKIIETTSGTLAAAGGLDNFAFVEVEEEVNRFFTFGFDKKTGLANEVSIPSVQGNNKTTHTGKGAPGEPKLVEGTGIITQIPRPRLRRVGGINISTDVNSGIVVNFNNLIDNALQSTALEPFDIINVTLPNNQQADFQQAFNSLGINAVLNFIDTDKTNEVSLEFIKTDTTVGDVDD